MVKLQSEAVSSGKGHMVVQQACHLLLIIIVSGLLGQAKIEGALLAM